MEEFDNGNRHGTTRESIDLESPPPISVAPVRMRRKQTKTSRLVASEIRDMIAAAYKNEVRSMITWRDVWKRLGDTCEAVAKGLTGVSAVLAFAASAIRDPGTADILSFTSGSVGTIGLVLLTYASYAIRESRQRTSEINGMLDSIGVTPIPDINSMDSGENA
jgi:hypothetical protein